VTWTRQPVAQALTAMFGAANPNCYVHERPPELVNPPAVVISRPVRVSYATAGLGVDEIELPVLIVGGIEQDDQVESVLAACRAAVDQDATLQGTVKAGWAAEERGWRNMTGAGGIQLLLVELILTIQM
jgi:hypothetical protein